MDLKLDQPYRQVVFQFSTPKKWWWFPLSWAIRWSEYPKSLIPFNLAGMYHSSHVSIRMGEFVYEAVMWLGVRKISVTEWNKLNEVKVVYPVPVDEKTHLKLDFYLEGSIGVPYSYAENVGIFIQRAVKLLFKREIKNPFKCIERKKKCSELAFDVRRIIYSHRIHVDRDSVGVRQMEEIINGH